MSLRTRISPEERRKSLRKLLGQKDFIRVLEAHNGLSAIIANNIKVNMGDEIYEFDAIWESSLTDSAAKGYPDANVVGPESRYETIRQILNSSTKPLIVDGDTGGEATNFEYFVRNLENMGVSMVIIEDKVFPKRNSLDPVADQTLEDPDIFAIKIKRGKKVQFSPDFMITARIESLISGSGLQDALIRARKYLNAGADAIMIHSKEDNPNNIFNFAREYHKLLDELNLKKPLVCVPTTYNIVTEDELRDHGFNIVIYANHMLRSAHKIMQETALQILKSKRAFEAESLCSPVRTIFEDVGFLEVREKDLKYKKGKIHVIIPAAGKDPIFDIPKSMIKIKGKTILQRQVDLLKNCGIKEITLIKGYKKELIKMEGINYVINDEYDKTYILHSLFKAKNYMKNGFIYINSDILFDEQIINSLLNVKQDIVLVMDNSYTYHKHEIDKKLDLVLTKHKPIKEQRMLYRKDNEIIRIGKNIDKTMADYEYIGIAYFSEEGVNIAKKIYDDCFANHIGSFHEAESFEKASFTDFIQEIVDRGFNVYIIEVYKGWFEIHNKKDIEIADKWL